MLSLRKDNHLFIYFLFIYLSILTGCANSKQKIEAEPLKTPIEIDSKDLRLAVNDTYKIDLKEYNNLKYISNDDNIASVDEKGNILAKKIGNTKIIISGDNYIDASLDIEVYEKVKHVKFSDKKIILEKNQSKNLNYTIEPSDAKIESKEWKIDDTNIVEISNDILIAKKSGKTKVTLVINNEVKDSFEVEVIVKPTKISFKEKNISIVKTNSKKMNINFEPLDTTLKNIKWKSENEKIAKVNNKGIVTAQSVGKTKLIATTDNNLTASIDIEVKPLMPSSISFYKKEIDLYKGNKYKLNVTINPLNSDDKKIKYTSSNLNVVIIDSNNNIVAKNTGTSIITAETVNGKKNTMKVNVRNNTYNKIAIFFGDSITYGMGHSWANFISENYDLKKVTNAGRSGWFISNFQGKNCITSIVKNYKGHSFDYVIMHGGANDINHNSNLGTFDMNDFSGKYDTTSFLGGLETYIYTVKKQWPNAKIGYIVNYKTPLRSANLRDRSDLYYSEMKKVLKKWNIKYIDLYSGVSSSGKTYSDLLQVHTYNYIPDGLHVNEAGYKLISPDIYKWMNTL